MRRRTIILFDKKIRQNENVIHDYRRLRGIRSDVRLNGHLFDLKVSETDARSTREVSPRSLLSHVPEPPFNVVSHILS